jgi:hypothetical protein
MTVYYSEIASFINKPSLKIGSMITILNPSSILSLWSHVAVFQAIESALLIQISFSVPL